MLFSRRKLYIVVRTSSKQGHGHCCSLHNVTPSQVLDGGRGNTAAPCLRPAVQERLLGHLETLEEGEQEQQGGETAACKVERLDQ